MRSPARRASKSLEIKVSLYGNFRAVHSDLKSFDKKAIFSGSINQLDSYVQRQAAFFQIPDRLRGGRAPGQLFPRGGGALRLAIRRQPSDLATGAAGRPAAVPAQGARRGTDRGGQPAAGQREQVAQPDSQRAQPHRNLHGRSPRHAGVPRAGCHRLAATSRGPAAAGAPRAVPDHFRRRKRPLHRRTGCGHRDHSRAAQAGGRVRSAAADR
jgi:hypothetical protein